MLKMTAQDGQYDNSVCELRSYLSEGHKEGKPRGLGVRGY
jgi:hypothetical protein